jgi:hypothetical protein
MRGPRPTSRSPLLHLIKMWLQAPVEDDELGHAAPAQVTEPRACERELGTWAIWATHARTDGSSITTLRRSCCHIVLRGKVDDGRDVANSGDYITLGTRASVGSCDPVARL